MDGNMSLKRIDGAGHTDERIFYSDYHIPPSDVDRFKDDVSQHRKTVNFWTSKKAKLNAGSEAPPFGNDDTVCTDNWAAANAVSEDTVKVFEQTGGFVSACRHGLVQSFVEMRKSGELAKYGLATLDKILKVFVDDQCVGCDIACSFSATVRNSSLATDAHTQRLIMALNSFHGHAHGRQCQLRWHPMYLHGLGLEDLETCERLFSASNAVARLTRHASYFHYLQFIDLHFQQWDDDKYLELSTFHHNLYIYL
jgi:Kyakuja-Dileera-Zisupton transposase